jgi:hypothetical protein
MHVAVAISITFPLTQQSFHGQPATARRALAKEGTREEEEEEGSPFHSMEAARGEEPLAGSGLDQRLVEAGRVFRVCSRRRQQQQQLDLQLQEAAARHAEDQRRLYFLPQLIIRLLCRPDPIMVKRSLLQKSKMSRM